MKDSDIQRYKAQLEKLRDELVERIEKLDAKKERDEALPADFEEQATAAENDEVIDSLDEIERAELEQVKNALLRIESGDFGTCAECENEISTKRLDAVPFSVKCMDCLKE
jgi:DnaK suppressor protein